MRRGRCRRVVRRRRCRGSTHRAPGPRTHCGPRRSRRATDDGLGRHRTGGAISGVSSTDPVSTTTTSSTMPASDSRQPPRNSASSLVIRTADSRADELPLTGARGASRRRSCFCPYWSGGVLICVWFCPYWLGGAHGCSRLVLPVLVGRRNLLGLVLPVLVGRRGTACEVWFCPYWLGGGHGLPCSSGVAGEGCRVEDERADHWRCESEDRHTLEKCPAARRGTSDSHDVARHRPSWPPCAEPRAWLAERPDLKLASRYLCNRFDDSL